MPECRNRRTTLSAGMYRLRGDPSLRVQEAQYVLYCVVARSSRYKTPYNIKKRAFSSDPSGERHKSTANRSPETSTTCPLRSSTGISSSLALPDLILDPEPASTGRPDVPDHLPSVGLISISASGAVCPARLIISCRRSISSAAQLAVQIPDDDDGYMMPCPVLSLPTPPDLLQVVTPEHASVQSTRPTPLPVAGGRQSSPGASAAAGSNGGGLT
ncbi:hypothetical protein VTK26DRAFT_3193 [Humicola hyalothermophila]